MTSRSPGARWARATLLAHLLALASAPATQAQATQAQATQAQATQAQATQAQATGATSASPTIAASPRVAVLPRVTGTEPRVARWAETLASRLRELAPGRDVRPLDPVPGECDLACVAARLTAVDAQAGVLLDVRAQSSRGATTVELALQLVAPDGTATTPIAASLTDGAISVELGPIVAGLPPAPPPPARLLIAVDVDGAEVLVDGTPVGETPLAAQELAPGEHEVTVRASGYETFSRRIDPSVGRLDVRLVPEATEAARLAASDDAQVFDAVASRDPLWKKWWLWAAVGGAVVVGLVIGVAVAASGGGDDGGFPVPPIPGRAMP